MNPTSSTGTDSPSSSLDPFSPDVLRDPSAYQAELRDAGPIVYLERYGVWATGRYSELRAILEDWETFSSEAGVGLDNFHTEEPWRPPALLIEADPPRHTRYRDVITSIMSPKALRSMRDKIDQESAALVDRLVARGSFDGVLDVAEPFPLKVFPDAVGMPVEGRRNLLAYGDMVFNAFGPKNEIRAASFTRADELQPWADASCRKEALSPDGFGGQIYAAVDAGKISAEEAPRLVRAFVSAGVDTTVNGIGSALYCLATNPEQFQMLVRDPTRAKMAFEEALRLESPIQTLFRTTVRDVTFAGHAIPAGRKVLLAYAAANRDPRRWENPDRFDITRNMSGHVAFGYGIHACVGQIVARLEGESILKALAIRADSLELTGEPVRRLNNSERGLASLPLMVTPRRGAP